MSRTSPTDAKGSSTEGAQLCQLDGVRFSTENPLGKAKPAPGKAAQASRECVRRWEKEKKKKKEKKEKENK